MARTFNTVLNRSGESEHPCLFPDVRGKTLSFSPLSMMLAGTCQRHSLAAASGHLHLLSISPQFLQVFAQISPQ